MKIKNSPSKEPVYGIVVVRPIPNVAVRQEVGQKEEAAQAEKEG